MKNRLRNLLCFTAVCLLLAGLYGCRPADYKISFFIYKGSDTFISELTEYMVEHIPEGISYTLNDAGGSQAVQNQQIVDLMDGGYDLFVINAVDRLACSSIVEKCKREGISVIFFNREPPQDALAGSDVYYIGIAPDKQGEKQAEIAAGLFGKEFARSQYDRNGDGVVQVAVLKGEQGHQDAEKRTDSCIARLRELGYRVEVLAISVADWERQKGYDAMRLLYSRHAEDIELLFCNNDDMALGAIDYLLETGDLSLDGAGGHPFPIIGVDATVVGLESIQKGLMYGTVDNGKIGQADAILTLTQYMIEGKAMDGFPYEIVGDHYIYIDGDIISRENVMDYIED